MNLPPNPRAARYRRLSLLVSGPVLLLLLATGLLPVVRRYTVINRTNQTLYVTPLIHYAADDAGSGAAPARDEAPDEDPARVAQFAVLSQYGAYHLPAWPARRSTHLAVPAGHQLVLFVDYEDLKQETGAQVLLVQPASGRLVYYLPADFWERTVVDSLVGLPAATAAMQTAAAGRGWLGWLGPAGLAGLVLVFPGLWLWSMARKKTA